MQSNDTQVSSSNRVLQYGPIQVRSYEKQVPTIATGRRPRDLVLDGDEAMKREKKRQRNREAARKIKEKRQSVEVELDHQLKTLENEHSNLQIYLHRLQQTKETLQKEVNDLGIISLDDLTAEDYEDLYASLNLDDDEDLFDESIETKNIMEYGPVKIRQIRKPAPTIATGRRPKHLVLSGDEAIKREQRRVKNREAARKLKEKRQLIEDELAHQLKTLEGENSHLETYLGQLQHKKQSLEQEMTKISKTDSLDNLLFNNDQDLSSFFKEYLHHPNVFDEPLVI
ncbi:hypothetical protein I4U23_014906 [Adineta vaga]|nr:hypothetical protein I4U23_014906 [Adineta vaga]